MPDFSKKPTRLLSVGRSARRRTWERLLGGVRGAFEPSVITRPSDDSLKAKEPEPPIVARLVVEIRSDGSRTVARGVLEDTANDLSTAVRAEGSTPLQLARALAGSLLTLPLFAARLARGSKDGEPEK